MSDKDFTFDFTDADVEVDFQEKPVDFEEPEVKTKPSEEEPEAEPEEDNTELHNEYLVIYDKIMFENKFEKDFKLGKKYYATFSTRSTEADMKVSRQLDSMEFSTMHAMQTMSAVLTMSHSLVGLNGQNLNLMSAAERYSFIRSKSSHLIELLSKHMITFDALVRDALEYGEENF